jgi:hypothetical protein
MIAKREKVMRAETGVYDRVMEGERREGRAERSERKEKRVEAEKDEGEGVSMTSESSNPHWFARPML